jgi:serine phosphatase RsbU (regulator of sigma subunit)
VGQRLRLFATLVAELVVSKTLYGDTLVRLRRTAPMGLAAEIQWNLLPPLTFDSTEVSVAAALEPAYEVAGDSVDYAVDFDVAKFAVFDGMGHELRSSQLVGLAVAAYRSARRRGLGLAQTAGEIDEAVTRAFDGEGLTTALLAELDTSTGQLAWLSAGHPPPLLLRHGHLVKTLEVAPRVPFGLGLTGNGPAADGAQVGLEQLEPGDYLLLYSDGVTEAALPKVRCSGSPDSSTSSPATSPPGSRQPRRCAALSAPC